MEQRSLIIGFMVITTVGVIVSSIIMFAMSGLGTQADYFLWQQIMNLFITLYFVSMIPWLLNESKKEQSQLMEENNGNLE